MTQLEAIEPAGTVDSKGLKPGALGLLSSVVVGMASTAPAYSLAASLGLVVATGAGLKAPAIMLLAFIPMYFIAVAYKDLNEAEPDCGTTFTWATRAFGPIVLTAACEYCLVDRVQHQIGGHRRRHLPAQDPSRIGIDDERHVHPAGQRGDVGIMFSFP